MRHALNALALLGLLASGCDRLQTDPIFAYGRAVRADGSPWADATFAFDRTQHDRPAGEGRPKVTKPDFTPYGATTTDSQGEFFLEMRYGDAQVLLPTDDYPVPHRFRLTAVDEAGAAVFVSFILEDDVELPALHPWDAAARVDSVPEGFALSFAPAPPAPETPLNGEIRYASEVDTGAIIPAPPTSPEPVGVIASGGKTLFQQWHVTSPWTFSPYVLEDFASPEVLLRARSIGAWDFHPLGSLRSSIEFRMEWRTAPVPLPSAGLRPVSRGAPCAPSTHPVCPWTDGKLDEVTAGTLHAPIGTLVITLDAPRRLKHAVVRGLRSGATAVVLEGSEDGEQWLPLGSAALHGFTRDEYYREQTWSLFRDVTEWDSPFDGPLVKFDAGKFAELPLDDVGPVRFVRLNSRDGSLRLGISGLAEVSLFE